MQFFVEKLEVVILVVVLHAPCIFHSHCLFPLPSRHECPLMAIYIYIFPQTVCPHFGVLTEVVRSGVLRGVLRQEGFDCAGSYRVLFPTTVPHRMVAEFWVVLPGVRARFEAKRGFT